MHVHKYLIWRWREWSTKDGARLISMLPIDRTRGNGHKLKYRKAHLNLRIFFFYYFLQWERLPRDTVESPSLEISKAQLHTVLGNLLQLALLQLGLGLDTLQRLTFTLLEQPLPQLDLKETQGTRYKEEIFYDEGGEALEQVSQRGCRCLIPGSIEGHVGWGSEQPDLVEDVPAHCRGPCMVEGKKAVCLSLALIDMQESIRARAAEHRCLEAFPSTLDPQFQLHIYDLVDLHLEKQFPDALMTVNNKDSTTCLEVEYLSTQNIYIQATAGYCIAQTTAPVPVQRPEEKGPWQGVCRRESHWM
ncbi:hypothetical protein QYF61_011682 [Mycteria americana]|uniref:Uncharacterized protein n=1 Tax=Mycteria americana TaxID=33587 RepID=A0AAN7NU70_MYCAM|nr:hypothetical protein QYF61_011682 [Mycteria americana]